MCGSSKRGKKKLPTGTVKIGGKTIKTDLKRVGIRKDRKKRSGTLLTESQIQPVSDTLTREEMKVNPGDIFFRGENATKKKQRRRLVVRGGVGRSSLLTSQRGGIGFHNKDA